MPARACCDKGRAGDRVPADVHVSLLAQNFLGWHCVGLGIHPMVGVMAGSVTLVGGRPRAWPSPYV